MMRALVALFAVVLCVAAGTVRADIAITLFKSFAGNVNFVGTQTTMRTKANGPGKQSCMVTKPTTTVSASLSGIPSTATILNAQLYWAGSSSTPDNTVTFEGASVTAVAPRQYISIGSGFAYFGGAVDVTTQVTAKGGNGTYTFSDLTINNGEPYCGSEGVVGGFALLVVYSDPNERFRVLNVYEGFQYIQNSGVTLTLSNFRMPNPLDGATGRVGHITWGGDQSIGQNGEDLYFNNKQMSDGLNPPQNQFNSASNINNDAASYGIDFDAYTVDSTYFTAGQTSIETRYQSGQDLVLLNAEIISVPNVPTADLSIDMTRNSTLTPGWEASYTLTVGNRGPMVENGPVVVTATLPVGLNYVSATGAGWSCSASGQVVTCSNASALAAGTSLPPILLTALVAGTGTMTHTATVTGQMFDNNSPNNTARDTSVAALQAYTFTDKTCDTGKAFGSFGQCKELSGAAILAGQSVAMFVTRLVNGVPAALAADTTVAMNFAISCINPATHAGKNATYPTPAVTLPLCTPNGGPPANWSGAFNMLFRAGQATAAIPPTTPPTTPTVFARFAYPDVGKIQLYLKDNASQVASSVPFVVKPASLAITSVTRSADNLANPATASSYVTGFAKVGEALTIKAAAMTTGGAVAPNFGNEGARLGLAVSRGGDVDAKTAMPVLPNLSGDFTSITGGVFTGSEFSFSDAGILSLTPRLDNSDYLGALSPVGVPTEVGRFYPAYFETTTTATLQCPTKVGCPPTVSGAAYSEQAFGVTVKAMSLSGGQLLNYNGVLARTITLGAFNAAGGATQNPSSGELIVNSISNPQYKLPGSFKGDAPRARNWTAPTIIYLRASVNESSPGGNVTIDSLRPAGTPSGEGGIAILSGRLALDNPHGSELQKMPVRAEAQYWTGTRWETSATDSSSVLNTGGISFTNCLKALGPACKPVLGVTADLPQTLGNGATTFWLRAPGAGNNGSAEFYMNNPGWLPSTTGRAVFGVYKSPLIYLREVY